MRNLIVSNFVDCICNCKILKQLLDSTGVVAYKLIHHKMQSMHWEVKAQLTLVSV